MNPKPRVLIASNNDGKIKEIQSILHGFDVELVFPKAIGLDLDIEEDGKTYAENAIKKAVAFSQASGLVALADDTGLEVDLLAGKPGLHSNRFGPKPHTDASRRAYLLKNLQGKPRPWGARFRATVAIAIPGKETALSEGVCAGEIIPKERGDGGFGYDSIFLLNSVGLTMAELSISEKNHLSHRGKAVQRAIPLLIKL